MGFHIFSSECQPSRSMHVQLATEPVQIQVAHSPPSRLCRLGGGERPMLHSSCPLEPRTFVESASACCGLLEPWSRPGSALFLPLAPVTINGKLAGGSDCTTPPPPPPTTPTTPMILWPTSRWLLQHLQRWDLWDSQFGCVDWPVRHGYQSIAVRRLHEACLLFQMAMGRGVLLT